MDSWSEQKVFVAKSLGEEDLEATGERFFEEGGVMGGGLFCRVAGGRRSLGGGLDWKGKKRMKEQGEQKGWDLRSSEGRE